MGSVVISKILRYSCYECGFGTSSMNELLLHKAEQHEGDLTKISPELLKGQFHFHLTFSFTFTLSYV